MTNKAKNTTQYVLDTTVGKRKQTHDLLYKQLEVKTNRTSYLCGNRSVHHNTELRTQRLLITICWTSLYANIHKKTDCFVQIDRRIYMVILDYLFGFL